MRLSALAVAVPHRKAGAKGDPEISVVTHDSRRAKGGTLFAAFPGTRVDGRSFIPDAVSHGASAALGLPPAPRGITIPYLEVENPRRAGGLLSARLHREPAEKLVLVGLTGTSGKTTTSILVDAL
ncbi:MAG TPA: Mur ligase domain-containing protein, partial [Thermoanaerobaculia bacterium]|nr:Mur ligase domain-containing protein [Thermoanaerobaculia bacterium]